MTLPSGEGTVGATEPATALDEDAAPADGLEPDTAGDAAGTGSSSAPADVGPSSDQDGRSAITESHAEPPSTGTELDGPALENDEMRSGTADLQSSEKKLAEAREIADDLTDKTQPSSPATVMPG